MKRFLTRLRVKEIDVEISAAIVKKLRDATNAGMMACKKALDEAGGDFAKAEKLLKEMGLAAVAKRADRATNNGRIFTLIKDNKAVILERLVRPILSPVTKTLSLRRRAL